MTTFVFRRDRDWREMWEALNDTAIHFASYAYKAITIFDDDDAEAVRNTCKNHDIKVKEV